MSTCQQTRFDFFGITLLLVNANTAFILRVHPSLKAHSRSQEHIPDTDNTRVGSRRFLLLHTRFERQQSSSLNLPLPPIRPRSAITLASISQRPPQYRSHRGATY